MLHFRGVQDFYLYRVPKEALPGRAVKDVELPPVYREGLMNSPYQKPLISGLAARIANFKHGVSRVGEAEEPGQTFGHMWKWVPARVRVHVDRAGRPLSRATVRWWRSRPAGLGDGRVQGVTADRAPDGTQELNRLGEATVREDYLGKSGATRDERSLWLLVEVESEGEKRFAIITGLWLNEMYAAGNEYIATRWLDWESMELTATAEPDDEIDSSVEDAGR